MSKIKIELSESKLTLLLFAANAGMVKMTHADKTVLHIIWSQLKIQAEAQGMDLNEALNALKALREANK